MSRSKRSRLMAAAPPAVVPPLFEEDRRLVDAYLTYELASRPSADLTERAERRRVGLETEWAIDAMATVERGDLERAFAVVIALIERAADDQALAYVGAGPLESLLARHGPAAHAWLIDADRSDGRFRQALRSVWGT